MSSRAKIEIRKRILPIIPLQIGSSPRGGGLRDCSNCKWDWENLNFSAGLSAKRFPCAWQHGEQQCKSAGDHLGQD